MTLLNDVKNQVLYINGIEVQAMGETDFFSIVRAESASTTKAKDINVKNKYDDNSAELTLTLNYKSPTLNTLELINNTSNFFMISIMDGSNTLLADSQAYIHQMPDIQRNKESQEVTAVIQLSRNAFYKYN